MNAFGGEDRLWLGPEGGQYSIFFRKGDPFDLEHWQTPPLIDSEPWPVAEQGPRHVVFRREGRLVNYSGTHVPAARRADHPAPGARRRGTAARRVAPGGAEARRLRVRERPRQHRPGRVDEAGGPAVDLDPGDVPAVAAHDRGGSLPRGPESELGPVVNDAYFGKVPADRLVARGGRLFFKGDGERRSKIGLSPERATGLAGQLRRRERATDDRQLHAARGRQRLRQLDVGDPEAAVPRRRRQQLQRRPARAGGEAARPLLRARDLLARGGARAGQAASPTRTGRSTSRVSAPFWTRSRGSCSASRSTRSSRRSPRAATR